MASDESRFNISLIVMDKVTRQYPQTTTFEERVQPQRNRTKVLLLSSRINAKPAHSKNSPLLATLHSPRSMSFVFVDYKMIGKQINEKLLNHYGFQLGFG